MLLTGPGRQRRIVAQPGRWRWSAASPMRRWPATRVVRCRWARKGGGAWWRPALPGDGRGEARVRGGPGSGCTAGRPPAGTGDSCVATTPGPGNKQLLGASCSPGCRSTFVPSARCGGRLPVAWPPGRWLSVAWLTGELSPWRHSPLPGRVAVWLDRLPPSCRCGGHRQHRRRGPAEQQRGIPGGLLLHRRQREVSGPTDGRVVACRVVRAGRGRLGGQPGWGW